MLSLGILGSVGHRVAFLAEYETRRSAENKERAVAAELQRTLFAHDTHGERTELVALLSALSGTTRAFFENLALAREIEDRFWSGEELLRSAGLLLRANKNDPIAKEYLDRAALMSEQNRAALARLEEIPGNCLWNARLWYLRGAVIYRALAFVKPEAQFSAFDLIEQAIKNFERVFTCVPRDRAAEVAIEKLYEQQKERGGGAGTAKADELRLKLLPQGELGPGTGGADRQQGRH
ncbi:MAG: hypothetical protein U1A28_03015 [Patescibacteria group bacterium]|nr:hypothetical protein [Patescibacteria group bacterium]